MPSDQPPPEPRAPGSDPAGRRRTTGAVRDGTLVFALVLGGFVAYALGARTIYRATAIVAVESIQPGVTLPSPSEAVQSIRGAALDPALVSTLAGEQRPVPPESSKQVGSRISSSLAVESKDGKRFSFSATAQSAERAQRVANAFAEQAAKRAAQVLDPRPQPEAETGAREKAALLDFLAAHPGIAAETPAEPTRSGTDPLVLALRAERIRIEAKLAEPHQATSENPYDELAPLDDPAFLKRRLKEIDSALEARAKPPAPKSSAPSSNRPTPEVRAEFQRLLQAVSDSKTPEPAATSTPRLRVTLAKAATPRLPIEPDRPRVVLLGVLIASVAGVLAGALRSFFEGRAQRRYGIITGAHAIVPFPQTTLRIPREQLPKPPPPKSEPLPTPLPHVPKRAGTTSSMPPAPVLPHPITPIPPAPVVPHPITPIPPAPVVPHPITPIPPAPRAHQPITPIPPAPVGPRAITSIPPAPLAPAPITPVPPPITPLPPALAVFATPIPPAGVAPPATGAIAAQPMVIAGPEPTPDREGPPTTQGYGEAAPSPRRGAKRRTTKIYGTPPPPDLQEEAKALRTTQAYGSPPAALAPDRSSSMLNAPTPIPSEVLPPAHRSSLRPSPMVPLGTSSSMPPAVAPSNRSAAPLVETGYSYVRTPVPPAHSIPQTPLPRRPSPPPQTQPYGSLPPVQPKKPPSDPPVAEPAPERPKTPVPPPEQAKPRSVVRTHPVLSGWQPDPKLLPGVRQSTAGEILTLAVERCHVIGVTGVRGIGDKKSRISVEVALALAEAKHPRILLVEGDFNFPQLQTWLRLDVPLAAGFSQQLRARIQGSKEGRWHVVECSKSLHVLAEGVMRSPGLLLSNQFEQAIRELRSYYDVIIIDAPLAPNEADGRALVDVVDGVLVVGPEERANEIVEVSRIFSGKALTRVIAV